MINNYTYKNKNLVVNGETISVIIFINHVGMIQLSATLGSMFGESTITQSYSIMDYSIYEALFMFKDYLKTI
jgi:hypothetical protein